MTKGGKALVSRQFVPMTRIRIEGLLAAFPKLVGSGKQHTYVETENVRYVYQPIDQGNMYLLLVTNKASNILEDLDTLRVLSKVLPEYTQMQTDEEGVSRAAFDLIFAFDEVISLGHKENVTISQVRTFTEMESHEEKLHKMIIQSKINDTKDVMKRKAMEIDKHKIESMPGGGGRSHRGMGGGGYGGSGVGGYHDDMGGGRGGMGGGGFGSSGSFGDLDAGGGGCGGMGAMGGSSRGAAAPSVPSKSGPSRGLVLGGKQKQNKFLENLRAEGEAVELDSRAAAGAPRAGVPAVAREGVSLQIEEKLSVVLKKDGGLEYMELQGTMMLEVSGGEEDAFIRVAINTGVNEGFQLKTHPNIDKNLHASENVLGLKDPNRPFPMGSPLGILKWRFQTTDESKVPLSINCWPSVSGGDSFVSIEYEAASAFDLHNVVIAIPLPALREPPTVNKIDGDHRYDSRRHVLYWDITLIDESNRNGSMEFVVPATESEAFFPISVDFTSKDTLCDVKVDQVTRTTDGGAVKFFGESVIVCESYQVV